MTTDITTCCNQMIPSILDFMSTTPLYVDVDLEKLKKMKDEEIQSILNADVYLEKFKEMRDEEKIQFLVDKYLKDIFVAKTKINDYICHFGMSFDRHDPKKEKGKGSRLFNFNYYNEGQNKNKGQINEKDYKDWERDYKNETNVPLKMYELLCEADYWKEHKFPMILMYNDNKPYVVQVNPEISITKLTNSNLSEHFKGINNGFKDKLNKLHEIFKKETWSTFKVFFTSNFKGLKSQTYIKFNHNVLFNKKNAPDLIRLCYLIDNVVGSIAYDFDRIINREEYYGEILKHGTKSAMTAIMSRNISHNIGSHVLSYWSNRLWEKGELEPPNSDVVYSPQQKLIKSSKELFQYIQMRSDFLAELSTSIPCTEMSLDIKDDIFDPFISPNREHYGDDKMGISAMLEYLAHSEENINLHERIMLNGVETLKSRRVSIPNGGVGVHAVYSILENFIRNAAKHYEKHDPGNNTMIQIDMADFNDNYVAITLWDMRDNSCSKKTIASYMRYLPQYISDIDDKKDRSFSSEDGSLQSGGWGIKEMLTSANFLRKRTPDDLYDYISNPWEENEQPHLLEVLCDGESKCKENGCSRKKNIYNGKLGIKFYLRKPKDLAVCGNGKISVQESKFAIERCNKKDIPHRMLVVTQIDENHPFNVSTSFDDPAMPCRIMINSGIEEINDKHYLNLYKKFINETIIGNQDNLLPMPQYICGRSTINICENTLFFENNNDSLKHIYHLNRSNIFNSYQCYYTNSNRCISIPYLQPLSAGYSTMAKFVSIMDCKDNIIKTHMCLELVESALTKVVIIDERISEWAGKSFLNGSKIHDILLKMGILVIDVNLNNISCS